jgi:hypothetical protein
MHPYPPAERQNGMPTIELLCLIVAAIVWIALLSTLEAEPVAR